MRARFLLLPVTLALVAMVACIPDGFFDRPATVYVESGCSWRHVDSAGNEMDTLELWYGRVVWYKNESGGRVVVHLPPGYFNRDTLPLKDGESNWVRVMSAAEYGTFEYALECFVSSTSGEPGEGTGIGGPKANVGDDTGGP